MDNKEREYLLMYLKAQEEWMQHATRKMTSIEQQIITIREDISSIKTNQKYYDLIKWIIGIIVLLATGKMIMGVR